MAQQDNQSDRQLPIIYHKNYNFGLGVLQKLHPFDFRKSGRVFNDLAARGLFDERKPAQPEKATRDDLALAHSEEYLDSLNDPQTLRRIFEVGAIEKLPLFVTRNLLLDPIAYHTGGSVLAGEMALKHGWAINLGGGFHHASSERGEGFCAIADISLSIKKLRRNHPEIKNVMIVDLDAHQGNGHELDFLNDSDVYTIDFYTRGIYPNDVQARPKINYEERLRPGTQDDEYLGKLTDAFNTAAQSFKPDIIYYIAGMDIMEGDPLGGQDVSKEGIINRDEAVFKFARDNDTPIVMLFGGGYQKNNAPAIADSIANLNNKFGLI